MWQRRSHAPSKAIPSSMSAKLRDNQLSIYSMFFEDMGWSLKVWKTTVCSQRAEWSTRIELSCWLSSWREIQSTLELCEETSEVPVSKLIDDYGSQDCGRFCNVIDTNGSVHFLYLLDCGTSCQVVHLTPQTSMQTKRNPTSQQSPADSRQYKMTTTRNQSIHQLLIKIKTKRTNQ